MTRPLPHYPRASLFAKSLSRDVRAVADDMADLQYTAPSIAAELEGLGRVVDLEVIVTLSQQLIAVARRFDDQNRRLRGVAQELSDFLR
jgi:hypothetical protein